MKKPTVDIVIARRRNLLEEWSPAHANWKLWEQYFNKKHPIRMVAPAVPRRLATGRSKVMSMVDTMVATNPHIERKPRKEGGDAQAKADKLEKWAEGVIRKVTAESLVIPPFRLGAENLALYGYTVSVVRWDEQNPDFPFVIDFPHPKRVLLPPMERHPSMAIETMTMYAYQVERMLDKESLPDLHTRSDFDLLQVVSSWDNDWQMLMVEGVEVYTKPNGFGFVPYGHGYAGKGHEMSPDYQDSAIGGTIGARPEDLAIGVLSSVLDSITTMDEYYTAMLALALKSIYKHYVTTEDAEETARQINEAGLAGVVQITPGGMLEWERSPDVQPFVNLVSQLARSDIDQGTFAGEVQGQRSPGVETATQHAMLLGTARMGFELPIAQLNYLAQDALGFCGRMMVARDESVKVDNINVSPSEFEEDYYFTVDFTQKDEAQILRAKESGMREVQAGLLDFDTYQQENAGRQDATSIRRKTWRDKIMKSDILLETVTEAADAAFRRKHGLPPKQQPQEQPAAPAEQEPYVPQPGGAVQAEQQYQGMTNVPGQPMQRMIPR